MADGKNENENDPMEDMAGDFIVLDRDGKTEDPESQKFAPRIDDGEEEIMDSFDSGDEDPIEPENKDGDEDDDEDGDSSDDEDGDDDEDQHDEGDEDEVDDEDDEASDEDGDEEDGDGDGDDADDNDDDDDDADPEPQKKKKRSPADRIKQVVKKQRQAERRAAKEKERADRLEAELAKKKLTGDDDDDNDQSNDDDDDGDAEAPDPTEYTYGELDPKYIADLAKHEAEKVLAADERKRKKETDDAAAAQAQKEWKENYDTKIDMGIEAYEDFEEVVLDGADDNKYPLTVETAQMAVISPAGHHVIYHLATNPDLAKKVAQMSVIEQAKEFGRLEARFEEKQTRNNKPNTKTKAPAPLKKRRGGGSAKQFDPVSSSFEDFEKNANKTLYKG